MDKNWLRKYAVEMFSGDDSVATAAELVESMREAGEGDLPAEKEMTAMLNVLASEGLLTHVGPKGYKPTKLFLKLEDDFYDLTKAPK